MAKVILSEDKCIGCGACVAISPENFDFNDEGLSKVINEEVSEKTMNALEACPVCAISVEGVECCSCECCDDECNCGDNCECDEECSCHSQDEHTCSCHCDCE